MDAEGRLEREITLNPNPTEFNRFFFSETELISCNFYTPLVKFYRFFSETELISP
jgi:hypothetical protein